MLGLQGPARFAPLNLNANSTGFGPAVVLAAEEQEFFEEEEQFKDQFRGSIRISNGGGRSSIRAQPLDTVDDDGDSGLGGDDCDIRFSGKTSIVEQNAEEQEEEDLGPVPYFASLNGLEITSIDVVGQQFSAQGFIVMFWTDTKLVEKAEDAGKPLPVTDGSYQSHYCLPDDGFILPLNPMAIFVNALTFGIDSSGFAYDKESGQVAQVLKWNGLFTQSMWLAQFPFDRIQCELILKNQRSNFVLRGAQLSWMKMPEGQDGCVIKVWEHWRDCFSMRMTPRVRQEYKMESLEADILSNPSKPKYSSRFQRRPHYYIWSFIAPCFILGLVNCTAFMRSMGSFGNKMDLNTAMLLTVVALRLTTLQHLPKINYMTTFDYYYASCVSFMVCVILINTYFAEGGGGGSKKRGGSSCGSRTTPSPEEKQEESIMVPTFISLWTLMHSIFFWGMRRNWWSPSWDSIENHKTHELMRYTPRVLRMRTEELGALA